MTYNVSNDKPTTIIKSSELQYLKPNNSVVHLLPPIEVLSWSQFSAIKVLSRNSRSRLVEIWKARKAIFKASIKTVTK